jgi:pyruvate dehydrogenase E2 component (dihydrolipoamide acetyltransferase)
MALEFKLPDVGEGTTEGEIVRWLVNVGDTVQLDQPMIEVETDKAVVELPAPKAGVILARFGEEGQTVPVGTTLVVIGNPNEKPPTARAEEVLLPSAPSAPEDPAVEAGRNEGVQAAPATRRLAREAGIDLNKVVGTGPRGRIVPEDVRRAMAMATEPLPPSTPSATAESDRTLVVFKGIRKKTAEHMALSWQKIPHVTVVEKLDASHLVAFRGELKAVATAKGLANLTYLPILSKIVAVALQEYPVFNARWDGDQLFHYRAVHMGFAVDTPDGLVVPVLRDAHDRGILDLARHLLELVGRARERKLTPEELTGSTITITGGGSLGGLFATPIINYPEVAIIGMYPMVAEGVQVRGVWEEHPMLHISLTFDHRIADGVLASRFLGAIKALLLDPIGMLAYLR